MRKSIVYLFLLSLCIDFLLYKVLDSGLPWNSDQILSKLSWQWIASGIRWVILNGLLSHAHDYSKVQRWLTTHCLLGPIFFTGRDIMLGNYPLEGSWVWCLNALAAASAWLFWELSWPDENGNSKETTTTARVLFKRVIVMYKPDYLLLFGAFVFLAFAVFCEYTK